MPKYKILNFFNFEHLPVDLQEISSEFSDLANMMADTLEDSVELQAGFRKLLEAKDCFVRAALVNDPL